MAVTYQYNLIGGTHRFLVIRGMCEIKEHLYLYKPAKYCKCEILVQLIPSQEIASNSIWANPTKKNLTNLNGDGQLAL